MVHVDRCFYVGDAAGRAKDHSDADIKFAQVLLTMFMFMMLIQFSFCVNTYVSSICFIGIVQAIGLKFYVPEEFFVE